MPETAPAPTNPSPKLRFQSVATNISAHRTLMDMVPMQRAFDFAILEYNRVLCEQTADANGSAANHFKMRGAMEFIHIMKNLSETPRVTAAAPTGNLQHNLS